MTAAHAVGRAFRLFDQGIDLAMPAIRGMLVLLIGATAWLAMDRAPPFRVIAVDHPPPVVAPGGPLFMRAAVWRDVDRMCSARVISRMHFSDGARLEMPLREYTAQELREQESRTPGRIAVALEVPDWAPAGPGSVSVSRYYQCNITHRAFPIQVHNTWTFVVHR